MCCGDQLNSPSNSADRPTEANFRFRPFGRAKRPTASGPNFSHSAAKVSMTVRGATRPTAGIPSDADASETARSCVAYDVLAKVKALWLRRAAWENHHAHLESRPHRWPESAAEAARGLEHQDAFTGLGRRSGLGSV